MIGEAYIRNWVAIPAILDKSRYFTERAEIMNPIPSPKAMVCASKKGISKSSNPGKVISGDMFIL